MDREKLEKAAEEYADSIPGIGGGGDYTFWHVTEGFEKGADWLMQQPISERLTEEEKQALCSYFNWEYWDRGFVSDPVLMTRYNQGRLVGIFGSDIFK